MTTNLMNSTLCLSNVLLAGLFVGFVGSARIMHAQTNQPFGNILLFADSAYGISSPYERALVAAGRSFQKISNDTAFATAVAAANVGSSLVIIDAIDWSHDFTTVSNFVAAGGRSILQYWNLSADSGLASRFDASVYDTIGYGIPPLYNWGGTPFFNSVSSPIAFDGSFNINGQKLNPSLSGQAVAGYVSSSATNQACIIIGNSGRTILNGIALELTRNRGDGVRVALNEIDFLDARGLYFISQPQSQKAVLGGNPCFTVDVGGQQMEPPYYQWFFNDTNAIFGATGSRLTITNAQISTAGNYKVSVSNSLGTITSANAALTLFPLESVTNVLYTDASSPYVTALANLGRTFRTYSDGALADANPGRTLVIIDSLYGGRNFDRVGQFAKAGGRAILQYVPGYGDLPDSLAAAFDAVVAVQGVGDVPPVYDWGGSSFFEGLTSPLYRSGYQSVNGEQLQPAGGGRAVAGFVGSPTPNQAAVIIGNSGHTIINSFILEGVPSWNDPVRFAQNEIAYVTVAPPTITVQPQSLTVACQTNATFTVAATGDTPLSYQWRKETSIIAGATTSSLTISNVQCADQANYSVIVSNAAGSLTSDPAALTLIDSGPPTIACPPDIVRSANSGRCSAVVTFTVTASDDCGVTNLVVSPASGSTFAKGTNLVTCTATDCAGNTSQCSFNVIVLDTEPPAIRCPSNMFVPCPTNGGTQVNFTVTATDNCDTNVVVDAVPRSGSAFSNGTTVVTCIAVDSSGNTNRCTFTVSVGAVLNIVRQGSLFEISWPASCGDYVLEETDSLSSSSWTPSTAVPELVGDRYRVLVPISTGPKFYRLKN